MNPDLDPQAAQLGPGIIALSADLPGAILRYNLPRVEDVEEPFDPITSFAVTESGRTGPLNENQLKDFLRENFDRRTGKTSSLIERYTQARYGVMDQLCRLRQRIVQIQIYEKDWTDFLRRRIHELIKVIKDKKKTKPILMVFYPNIVKRAIQKAATEGPLTEQELRHHFNTGSYDREATEERRNQIITQMKNVLRQVQSEDKLDKLHFDFTCKQILKAIKDIKKEEGEFIQNLVEEMAGLEFN